METYVIRITTIDNLYADYMIEAKTILEARNKAKNAFLRDYPESDNHLRFSLRNSSAEKIKEILLKFKGGK